MLAMAVAGACFGVTASPAAASPAAASPAQAAPSCPYPYVCFIKNDRIIGKFKDVTSDWQPLPSKPSAPLAVVNTRHDDVVRVRFTSGSVSCIPPKTTNHINGGQLNAVRISSSTRC
ncbi:hypothetical protein GCM10009544_04650 [Streptomyces stramineus]|uniref:Peptidase inhibitor family I36 protein n=1 Tax=Streptomyces stramineus TaxID=173861 RepID=A0ABP3JB99_9ACTN